MAERRAHWRGEARQLKVAKAHRPPPCTPEQACVELRSTPSRFACQRRTAAGELGAHASLPSQSEGGDGPWAHKFVPTVDSPCRTLVMPSGQDDGALQIALEHLEQPWNVSGS